MSAKSVWIQLPRHVVVGEGALDHVPEVIEDLNLGGRGLIVTGPTPKAVAADDIATSMGVVDVEVIHGADAGSIDAVMNAADDADYLVGVGGGTPIDIAKLASERLDLPFLAVPTTASHDGIVSGRASIPDGETRHSIAAAPPLAVVADTAIIAEAPWELTTAGCADIISNYTAVRDWRLAHRLRNVPYSEYASALSEMTAEMLVENAGSIRPGHPDSAWIVVKALVSSGVAMSIAGSSRPASGAEHLISHQLDRIAPGRALHGHQVGVASLVTSYLQTGEGEDWRRIRDALERLDAPTTAAELDLERAEFLEALTSAHQIRDRYTILGDGIEAHAAEQAATVTGVV